MWACLHCTEMSEDNSREFVDCQGSERMAMMPSESSDGCRMRRLGSLRLIFLVADCSKSWLAWRKCGLRLGWIGFVSVCSGIVHRIAGQCGDE
jgi:hypothetical protein